MRMLLAVESQQIAVRKPDSLRVRLAERASDVEAAKRLRYRVFVEEMGARIGCPRPGVDEDRFDPWCDHLIVEDPAGDEVVGTYRLLDSHAARRLGGCYGDTEFDLARLAPLREAMVEVGRSCIHPAYRTGGVIARLWQAIAGLALQRGYRHLIGCASLGLADRGATAASVYRDVLPPYLAPLDYRVTPYHPLAPPADATAAASLDLVPPLLRAYLRLGAWIGGPPAWDPDFNVADFFVLLPLARLRERYVRRFLRAA